MTDQINKNLPRDVFLYLLSIITLVASAVSFGNLAFQLTDIRFPDALQYISGNYESIRMALATLLVVFPVFLWVSWFLRKDVVADPVKKELKIRRWLMYLTVFAASLVVIGDLVALIYNFLEGDLTARFMVKVLIVLFIAGPSLFYYLAELRDIKYRRNLFFWVVVITVAVSAGRGFYVAGSPQNQRMIRFDETRVGDLSSLQNQIINYWQKKNALPQNLGQLANDILGIVIPKDPKTGAPYEYSILSDLKFELCATFETSTPPLPARAGSNSGQNIAGPKSVPVAYPAPGGNMQTWQHGAGRTCFQRTIDSALFKVEIPKPL